MNKVVGSSQKVIQASLQESDGDKNVRTFNIRATLTPHYFFSMDFFFMADMCGYTHFSRGHMPSSQQVLQNLSDKIHTCPQDRCKKMFSDHYSLINLLQGKKLDQI